MFRNFNSSTLRSAMYMNDTTLLVEFTNGAVYSYYCVPMGVVQELFNAPSAGKFFNKNKDTAFKNYSRIK